jgi:branched-chain amino acid transport system ATP-binding protein
MADLDPVTVASSPAEESAGLGLPLLEAVGLTVGYDTTPVVRDLDLQVAPGEVVALLGANGAGKTTTLRALAGELTPMAGDVRWQGQPTKAPLHVRARQGLRFITEERSVFMTMTAGENLQVSHRDIDPCLELFPELRPLLKRRAGLLSGGEQQILTLARALVGDVKVLLADELSLGLAPLIVERLLAAVRSAADRGVAVVLVEQQTRHALRMADKGIVLRRGRVVMHGHARELLSRADEIEASYLAGPTDVTGAETR